MKFTIPNMPEDEEQPFADCIDYAAERCNVSDERVLQIVSHFFERLADNMGAGRVVSIPAFGKFGAWLEEREARHLRYNRGFPYCVPKFVAAKPLRAQIKMTAPINKAAKEVLQNLRRNASRNTGTNALVHTEHAKIRASIARQLGQ